MHKQIRSQLTVFSAGLFLSIFFLVSFPAQSFCQQEIANDDCLTCHDNIKLQEYKGSVHGADLCTSCHNDIRAIPHADKVAKVNCSNCHAIESQIYNASDHGRAAKNGVSAAGCLDCHGQPHAILDSRNREAPTYHLNIPKTCAKCHDDEKKMTKYNLLEKQPFLSYSETVHGKAFAEKGLTSSAVCTDCHGSHNLSSPINPKSKIYRSNVPATCGKCHENVLNTYLRSIHGKSAMAGVRDAPVCTDCHGEHTIKAHTDPTSSVYSAVIAQKTCGQCHAAEKIITKYHLPGDRLETYFQSYHGLASKLGVATVANCASCHGFHDILPSSDPDSAVNKRNLPKTCGKCHPNAGVELSKGSVHLSPSHKKDQAVYYVSLFYIFLIIMTIGGMLVHNIIDFWYKFRLFYRRRQQEDTYVRFTEGERIQHTILMISFILLAYTGFALRFPGAWWAIPFKIWDPGFDWRGVLHRIMAAVFIVLSAYHVVYLLFTKRGRGQLKALMIKWRDVRDAIGTNMYHLGMSQQKPKYARYNYIEKAEYWALVWGSLIMITTGSLLMFKDFFFQFIPNWIFDVARTIHYFEAVLAVLAILVWHLYFTIFDPPQYPMNLSMTTGKVSEEDRREEDDEGKQKAKEI